jgi:putative molybdopterin biosynthesis protein
LKVLADARRLAILRLLMKQSATLSQLGRALGAHPAKVRHHLKKLEGVGLVELTSMRVVGGFIEKYYRASASAYMVNLSILPVATEEDFILTMGSHDPGLELLGQQLKEEGHGSQLFCLPVGSLDGLLALRQGICQMAGCHLLDEDSGEYNRDFVKHIFPGQRMLLITLAQREQGLLIKPGNPQGLGGLQDLEREEVKMVNRQPGSGTRLWLDRRLKSMNITASRIRGYQHTVDTHDEVGKTIAEGKAAVGVGLLATALKFELEFLPLFEERFELVMPTHAETDTLLQPLLDHLNTARFKRSIAGLGGYHTTDTGKMRIVES